MWTFGLAMIVGNLAFVSPKTVRATVHWLLRPLARLAGSPERLPSELLGSVRTAAGS